MLSVSADGAWGLKVSRKVSDRDYGIWHSAGQSNQWLHGGTRFVGELYDLKVRIEEKIKTDGLDGAAVKGTIGLRSGKLLAFINSSTPDDPQAIANLRAAVKEVLNVNL